LKIKTYTTLGGKDLIIKYLNELPRDEMLQGYAILKKLENSTTEIFGELDTRQLVGKLWEIKFYRHNRLFYVVVEQESLYILHACKKQKGKAEKFELDKALKRMKEITWKEEFYAISKY